MRDSSGVSENSKNVSHRASLEGATVHVLASLGFACLLGWELSVVFSPSMLMLSFCGLQDAVLLRVVSVLSLAATFVFCARRSDWVFACRNRVLAVGSLLAFATVLDAWLSLTFGPLSFAVSFAAWLCVGVAQASLMMYWCVLFSLIPSRGTPTAICVGSVIGTSLFALVNSSVSMWANLGGIALLVVGSVGLALYLSRGIGGQAALPREDYRHVRVWSAKAALSTAAQGVVYGFMVVELCSMGFEQALIGGASGMVGTLVALLWALLGARVDVDAGVVQRMSLPPLVASLLLFPCLEGGAQVACACVANMTLAHSRLFSWYSTSVENYEFRLHPVDRFASRQAPNQVGFFVGSVLAYILVFVTKTEGAALYLIMAVIAIVVVSAFSLYAGDESETKARLSKLLSSIPCDVEASDCSVRDGTTTEQEELYYQSLERNCELAAEKYSLTSREREVFAFLAKGRNAAFIADVLGVSTATVKSHIYHIYQKLGISSQQSLIDIVDGGAGDVK